MTVYMRRIDYRLQRIDLFFVTVQLVFIGEKYSLWNLLIAKYSCLGDKKKIPDEYKYNSVCIFVYTQLLPFDVATYGNT